MVCFRWARSGRRYLSELLVSGSIIRRRSRHSTRRRFTGMCFIGFRQASAARRNCGARWALFYCLSGHLFLVQPLQRPIMPFWLERQDLITGIHNRSISSWTSQSMGIALSNIAASKPHAEHSRFLLNSPGKFIEQCSVLKVDIRSSPVNLVLFIANPFPMPEEHQFDCSLPVRPEKYSLMVWVYDIPAALSPVTVPVMIQAALRDRQRTHDGSRSGRPSRYSVLFQEDFQRADFAHAFEVVSHRQRDIFSDHPGESVEHDGHIVDQQGEAFLIRLDESGYRLRSR